MLTDTPYDNNLKDTRIIVLKVKDGEKAKSSKGMADPRLFTGENQLLAVMNPQTCLWGFKYTNGGVPEPLKQKFTKFGDALSHARTYYASRGVEIVEVID